MASTPAHTPKEAPEFHWYEGLALCLAMIGVQLGSEVINTWGTYFYSPTEAVGRTVYVPVEWMGIIFVIGTIWEALTGPLVGSMSDRTPAKPGPRRFPRISGRRRPFIFWGALLLLFTTTVFWYPPVNGTSWVNFLFGTLMLCMHWSAFMLGYVPATALSQEIARSEKARISMGIWVGVGLLSGLALAAFAGELITVLDPAREAGAVATATGYRRMAGVVAVLCCLLFMLPVMFVRERFDKNPIPSEQSSLRHGVKSAMANPLFITFFVGFTLFATGLLAAQKVLPYWAELALGGDEGTVTLLFVPFLITGLSTYALIPLAARWLSAKRLTCLAFLILASGMPLLYPIAVMDASPDAKFWMGAALFGYAGIAQGIIFVMAIPVLGQIIDFDEERTGHRREALYNGLNNLTYRVATAGAVLAATQAMRWLGNSPEHPLGVYLVGPIAGLLALLGFFVMLRYPEPKSTR